MELKPEDAVAMQHKGWLDHPCTKQFLAIAAKQREYVVKGMSGNAFTRTPEEHKMSAVAINTIDTIVKYTTNTEQFIKQLVA